MGAVAKGWVVVVHSGAPIMPQSERNCLTASLATAAKIAPCVTGRFLVRLVVPMLPSMVV
jgi:hypothetical protein